MVLHFIWPDKAYSGNMTTRQETKPCPHCGVFPNRGVTIDAVIVNNGKILLIKRGAEPFKGYWALVGGYVEWNESAEEAALSEVKEEVGVTASITKLIGVYSDPARHPKQAINIAYAVEIEGEPQAGDDAVECKWFSLNELPELAFDHAKIVQDYLQQH